MDCAPPVTRKRQGETRRQRQSYHEQTLELAVRPVGKRSRTDSGIQFSAWGWKARQGNHSPGCAVLWVKEGNRVGPGGWEKQSRRGNHLHKGRDPPVAVGIETVSNRLQDLLEQRSTARKSDARHARRGSALSR